MSYHLIHRQDDDPLRAPSGTGIAPNSALTVDPGQGTAANTLAFDTKATPSAGPTVAPPLAPTVPTTPTIPSLTTTPVDPAPSSPSASGTVDAAGSSSSSPISMSTVIGSCVGAFIGAVALICLGVWFYRRYSRSLKQSSRPRGPLNTRGDSQRRRSHREPWGKLEDTDLEGKWEAPRTRLPATQQSDSHMEKLAVFKKAPTLPDTYTPPEEPFRFEIPHPFAQYPPTQARSNESTNHSPSNNNTNNSTPAPLTARRDDTSHALTWGDAAQKSFLTVRTNTERLSGAMSPTLNMAIPTPPAIASPQHYWESAEIVNIDEPNADYNTDKAGEKRKSVSNPFFGAHEDIPRSRSRSNSFASRPSRTNSTATSVHIPLPRMDKGKGRAVDPFDDDHAPFIPQSHNLSTPTDQFPIPRPTFTKHSPADSDSSGGGHALASLLAALDGATTEEEVQARLRIASLQPSINTVTSMYSEGEEDVTKDFPLPPLSAQLTGTEDSFVTASSGKTVRM